MGHAAHATVQLGLSVVRPGKCTLTMQPTELPPEPAPPPDEGTPPAPVELPEPYPPDELDRPTPLDPEPEDG